MRTSFLVAGLLLCFAGGAIIFYQLSETCEEGALAETYIKYPWCTDILTHTNFTFIGVLGVMAGIIILLLGTRLHWILGPGKAGDMDS